LTLLTIMLMVSVSAETFESGTYNYPSDEIYWFTGFGDFGSAFPFVIPSDGTLDTLSLQFYACEGDSGQGDPATSPTKISIRSVLNLPYNDTSEDLWSYTFNNCGEMITVYNGSSTIATRGFYDFPVDIEVTNGTMYYVVVGTTETYQGAQTGGNLVRASDYIYEPYLFYFDGNSIWNLMETDEAFYGVVRNAWFNLTYTVPTPPTGGLTPYTPTHGISSVTGLVIDFGVEMGVQYILFAGLIAIIGLGIWGYSIYRRGGM